MSKANLYFKTLILLTFLFFGSKSFAQLSDLHYLPPLRQGENNAAIENQAIYLSTPETTAFTVNAYRGTNTATIATFSISNVSPAIYTLAAGNNNITLVDEGNTGVILTTGGLRFESPGGQDFYVNYRGNSNAQGASLTSKGRVAMGQSFKWGGVPNLGPENSKSNTLGIMATQDNTSITLSGYDPDCEFRVGSNRAGITDDSYTVTLDENESFVFETYIGTAPTAAHESGWIGASIVSDKDIVISNGSMNFGREAEADNRDAGIDQPVPENRLGKEYVFVRGNGSSLTEFPLIIATENHTQIFVNGSATPIATLNDGDFFEIASSHYSSNSVGANMYVETSKDVYAYQCVGGSTQPYTQGLNFVAPVSCLLSDTMDNIPNITDAAGVTITGGVTIIAATTTPDNNITVTDGSGTVTLPPSTAAAGTSDWKTFYLSNLTGNVSVRSTGPIAVGFFGFNGARGVAGYYSGFDTVPSIDLEITGIDCLPGAVLEISSGETFDAYQWFGDGALIPGATNSSFAANVAGDYFLRITRGPCTYDSNSISVYYCNPDIQLIKTSNETVMEEGGTVTFNISVQNFGVDPATSLVVSDVLPAGLSLVSATPSIGSWSSPNWTIGTLMSGVLETITITAVAADLNNFPYRNITNIAFNNQDQVDSNLSEDSPFVGLLVNYDNDDDNVIDSSDLDDDNDGILDTVECPVSISNFALTGTATFSSTFPEGDASKAIDGDTNGNWSAGSVAHSGNTTSTEWLTVDLGVTEFIDEIRIWNRTDCCSERLSNAYIMVSESPFQANANVNESLANAALIYEIGDTNGVTEIIVPAGLRGRYVRLQQSGKNPNSVFINIGELQVLGPETCDVDTDSIPDVYDLDSDADGCNDAIEAYNDVTADGGDGDPYGTGTPPPTNGDGTVVAASYATPNDSDSNSTYDFQEAGASPIINTEPTDQRVFIGNDGAFDLTDSNTDEYQWEVSTDGGSNFIAISDGTDYSGTQTNTLTLLTPDLDKNGFIYRAVLLSDTFICGRTISNEVTLTVGPRTVITNRRITLRVKKN